MITNLCECLKNYTIFIYYTRNMLSSILRILFSYLLLYFIVFTVFIHSATNVTLDITFTSYITFLTYKHY